MSDNATSQQKPLRLRKRAEFLAVRQGEKRRGKLFLLEVNQRDEAASKISKSGESPRVGFTVTKKNGNAVIRNRIRRRLKAAVSAQAGIHMDKSTDYVIVARKDVLNAPFTMLTSELVRRIKQPASRSRKASE